MAEGPAHLHISGLPAYLDKEKVISMTLHTKLNLAPTFMRCCK